ncbi:MarR family transcriptional regulator [Novosphingobium beihaiensis]|uniref:Winged helix DNA-binding protein n=1 Tax=Novosphingobium beihaiensis TaxID=2930389 RepID=A0ABT0BKI8_9SPHN|nr:MarR family transcriptional regulator [Novosphingobium beihaiensis]MCJ2185490.1 winged helix DNA-binding protein [Novosphingobium beihaiensis]
MTTRRIRDLTDELNELIARIEIARDPDDPADPQLPFPTIDDWLETAQDLYDMRRQREKIFGSQQLFGEPTWDILLDLFIAELKNTRMQTTSVCIGAQVPQTTALRWITLLEKEGLVHRYRDKTDTRRVFIQLTDRALRKMVQIFYDRCFTAASQKKAILPKLAKLPCGSGTHDDARDAIMNDVIAQIRGKRQNLN